MNVFALQDCDGIVSKTFFVRDRVPFKMRYWNAPLSFMWKCTHLSLEMNIEMHLALQACMPLCRKKQDSVVLHCLQVLFERLIVDLTFNNRLPWGPIMQRFIAEGCTSHCEESHWLQFWKNSLCKREIVGIVEHTLQMISNVVSKSWQKLQKWLWQVSKLLSKREFSLYWWKLHALVLSLSRQCWINFCNMIKLREAWSYTSFPFSSSSVL